MNEREKRCLSPVTKLKSRKRKLAEKFINQKRRKITGKREVGLFPSGTELVVWVPAPQQEERVWYTSHSQFVLHTPRVPWGDKWV